MSVGVSAHDALAALETGGPRAPHAPGAATPGVLHCVTLGQPFAPPRVAIALGGVVGAALLSVPGAAPRLWLAQSDHALPGSLHPDVRVP
ncbi:MAG: hypothetical protein AAFY53_13475, partial [Pseudomonadota bacterium]